jgi:drug/metabolite transporter (DMT)-like permease
MRKGIYFASALALLSGVSIFLNSFAVKIIPNAFFLTTTKNFIVVFFLAALIILFKRFKDIKKLSKKEWLILLLIGLIGGSISFLLFFKGLSISAAAAVNGAFIQKTLFIWVAFLALIFLREKFSIFQYAALLVILLGIYLMGGFKSMHFGQGEILIFMATLMWAAEAIIVKKVIPQINYYVLAFGRMFFGSLIMIAYLLITHNYQIIYHLNLAQTNWILLTSVLLLGYVIFYYGALNYTKATVVISILTFGFPVTLVLQGFYTGIYTQNQIFGAIIITVGIILFLSLPMILKKIKKEGLFSYGRN